MIQTEFTTIILKAEEGKYLTQVEDVDVTRRLIASEIALGKHDSAENYREITAAEAEVIRRQMRAAREAEAAQQTGDRVQEPSESEDIE